MINKIILFLKNNYNVMKINPLDCSYWFLKCIHEYINRFLLKKSIAIKSIKNGFPPKNKLLNHFNKYWEIINQFIIHSISRKVEDLPISTFLLLINTAIILKKTNFGMQTNYLRFFQNYILRHMKNIFIKIVLPLALISAITMIGLSSFSNKPETVIFKTDIAEDASPQVLAKMMSAKKNSISEIKFEKGTYHFYPDKAYESFQYVSNHGDNLVRTAFPINGFKNLTIDGQGSTFIFHGRMIPFQIDHSENIKIKNVSVDWAESFHSEGLVVANNSEEHTFDIKISEKYPYEIRNNQLFFIKEYYEHELGQTILYDPNRKAIAFETENFTPLSIYSKTKYKPVAKKINYKYKVDKRAPGYRDIGREKRIVCEEIEPGIVRIHHHKKRLPPVGMMLVAKGDQGFNRVAPGIRLTATDGFEATNVNMHHAGGMGLIAENCSDLTLDNFNVTPTHGRMVSTTADATHFVGCRGKVTLKNCTFNNQLDDATNIHGTYQEVIDILGERKLGVRMGHFQQQGFVIGKPNDEIGLIRLEDSFFPFEKIRIKSVEVINGRYQILTFQDKLPTSIQQGDLIENLDAYPEVLVQNCNISKNRARGLLLSSPKKTVIENNFFGTEMEALLIPVESGHWYESGSATNLIIRNNTFQDCSYSGYNRGLIRFVTDDDNENIAFKNIEITGNKINHFDNLVLEIANTDNLKITGNTITQSGTFPKLHPDNPAIKIKSSKNIIFNNNTYTGDAETILETDKSMKKITFQ